MGAKRPRVWQSTCNPSDLHALHERYCWWRELIIG